MWTVLVGKLNLHLARFMALTVPFERQPVIRARLRGRTGRQESVKRLAQQERTRYKKKRVGDCQRHGQEELSSQVMYNALDRKISTYTMMVCACTTRSSTRVGDVSRNAKIDVEHHKP